MAARCRAWTAPIGFSGVRISCHWCRVGACRATITSTPAARIAVASAPESLSSASTAAGVTDFHTSLSGRAALVFECTRNVSLCWAKALVSRWIRVATAWPTGQSGSRQSTTSDRPLRWVRAAADGA